jgi:hypothetical protein
MLRHQAHPLSYVLFSRRRSTKRYQQRGSSSDWIWVLGLGLVALLVFGGGFLLYSTVLNGGSSDSCDKALVPLETSDVSAKGFVGEDVQMGKMVDQLNAGQLDAANVTFYGPVHNFTHNADPPVRAKNEQLAKDLCHSVLTLEDDLAFNAPVLKLSGDAQKVRDLLRNGAEALGYPRPG